MAFTTTRGESGVDFIGTDGVDALFVINEPENNVVSGGTGVITIDAKAGNDNVDLTNESGVTGNAEVKLGEGDDVLTMGGNAPNRLNRLVDSFVNGGPGNDDITTEGTVSSKLRGNEGDDDFFLISNYTNSTINGNSGNDSFVLNGATTISDTKILGGADNDGQINLSAADLTAVDSVVQGGKGLDTITIGDLGSGSSNLRVTGGADNDTITVQNTNVNTDNSATYNGAAGDDSITFALTNAANASSKGGEGADRMTVLGGGEIVLNGEAGDDLFTIAAATEDGTVVGAEGADSYDVSTAAALPETTFTFNSVSDSAAATSGTTRTFDFFRTDLTDAGANTNDIIDLVVGGTGEALVGNRLFAGDEVGNVLAAADLTAAATAATSFAALKTAIDGLLTPSDPEFADTNGDGVPDVGQMSINYFDVAAAGIAGSYVVLNNTNNILDSGDMMFQVDNTAGTLVVAQEIEAMIERGF